MALQQARHYYRPLTREAHVETGSRTLPLDSPASLASPRPMRLAAVAAVLVGIAQAWRLWQLADRYSVDVPFLDQWDFYSPFFFAKPTVWALFTYQHGPHRQGIGFLLAWLVNWLTNWDQRAQCFMICIVAYASALVALWLRRRLAGRLQWYDGALPLIILSPQQWEVIANTPNVSHGVLPLLLILLCCLAWTIAHPIPRYALVLLCTFLATYTGFGVFLGVLTPVLLGLDLLQAIRRRERRAGSYAAVALLLSVASLASFFHGYIFTSATTDFAFPDPKWRQYPVFMGLLYVFLYGTTLMGRLQVYSGWAILASMGLIAAVLAWGELRLPRPVPTQRVALLLIGFSLLFAANVTIGRMSTGLGGAMVSRYIPLLMPAAIGVYLLAADLRRADWREGGLAVVLLATVFATVPHDATKPVWFRENKSRWVTAYHLTGSVKAADEVVELSVYPDPPATRLDEKLLWLRERHYSLFREDAPEKRLLRGQ